MTILVATNGSEEIYSASRLLIAFVQPNVLERVILMTVTWPPNDAPIWDEATMRIVLVDDMHRAVAIVATEAMEKIAREFAVLRIEVETLIRTGDAAEQILEVAQQRDVDVIVIGRHAQKANNKSVSERVLMAARCPVLVGSTSAANRTANAV